MHKLVPDHSLLKKRKSRNKKIKNTSESTSHGLTFRSRLEGRIYETLLRKGIEAQYEPAKIKIWDDQSLSVPYFDRFGRVFKKITTKPRCITYTPDFTFTYKETFVFLEVKGYVNDVFPYKAKLFRSWLEEKSKNSDTNYCYAVVYTVRDLETLLKYLDET